MGSYSPSVKPRVGALPNPRLSLAGRERFGGRRWLWSRNRQQLGGLGVVGAYLLLVGAAWQIPADPLAGRWELNVARTHYGGGAEPRTRESFECAVTASVVKCTIHSVRVNGRVVAGSFAATYGGPPGRTEGIPDVDQVRLVRVSASIADATFTSQGRAVFAYRAVRSDNGRTLTIISVDPVTHAELNSVVAYDLR